MGVKSLIYNFLPLVLWISFVKVLEGFLFPFYTGDSFLALALILLSLKDLNFLTFISLFFLGVLKGIFSTGEIFWGVIFVLVGVVWKITQRYIKLDSFKFKIIFWILSVFLISLVNLFFFFYRFKSKLEFELIISLFLKMSLYFCSTFIWILVIYWIMRCFFKLAYDKVE